jgi:hypothetical protein
MLEARDQGTGEKRGIRSGYKIHAVFGLPTLRLEQNHEKITLAIQSKLELIMEKMLSRRRHLVFQ